MEWIAKPQTVPSRLGLLPGGFNPPTRAHVALAEAALVVVDEVILVMPRAFPHKRFEGATAEERIEMMRRIASSRRGLGVAIADCGLYIDIVREARREYPQAEMHLVCGRDAAERFLTWDYGEQGTVERMLEEFRLLVAPRLGPFEPPPHLVHAIAALETSDYDECSSTLVRSGCGLNLVPNEIADLVQRIYR
jgi:cytidyltransferase-like protein